MAHEENLFTELERLGKEHKTGVRSKKNTWFTGVTEMMAGVSHMIKHRMHQ